jgi:hypothetical protein
MYIYTAAEADYIAARNDYENARPGFYAGTVSAQDFIALREAMENALTAWEADRAAA